MAAKKQPPPESSKPPAELKRGAVTDVVVPLAAATIAGPGTVITAHVLTRPKPEPPPEVVIPPGVEKPD